MKYVFQVRGDKALEILERGLKVKEFELLHKNFSETGNFGFGISGGYTDIENVGDLITIGANMSFGGFTVAGTYQRENAAGPGAKGDEFAIGMQYATGPWTIGGGFASLRAVPFNPALISIGSALPSRQSR